MDVGGVAEREPPCGLELRGPHLSLLVIERLGWTPGWGVACSGGVAAVGWGPGLGAGPGGLWGPLGGVAPEYRLI